MKRIPPSGATRIARLLRADPTEAEKQLWRLLREAFPDARFRRQVPIRQYIVDFASHRAKIVIEADGGQHTAEIDAARTAVIEADGYRVIRFWNNDILGNSEGVHQMLASAIAERAPPPNLPHQGGGLRNRQPFIAAPPPATVAASNWGRDDKRILLRR